MHAFNRVFNLLVASTILCKSVGGVVQQIGELSPLSQQGEILTYLDFRSQVPVSATRTSLSRDIVVHFKTDP